MFYVIPKPNCIEEQDGVFLFNKSTNVTFDFPVLQRIAEDFFRNAEGLTAEEDNTIHFKKTEGLEKEQYRITSTRDSIIAESSDEAGALYAFQTLRQILRLEFFKGNRKIHNSVINDKPHYAWRGILFDDARHFFGKDVVKETLDYMALHKLNVFHWHLTDDQGWRIQIDAFPKLTEVCSKRRGSQIHGWKRTDVSWKPHEGFYTKDDIREIVAYAAERNIMVVPEIDMPAHCIGVMAAYPELACKPFVTEVPYYFGAKIPITDGKGNIFENIACAGKESTYEFLFKIIDEVVELFPAPYFHIGGDEAPKAKWKNCPDCQKKMKEEGLKNEEDLHGYFNNRIADYLKKYGKSLVGWNEILKNKTLSKDAIAQYWTPLKDVRAENYSKNGGKLIISKHQTFYFDMGFAQNPLKKTYEFTEDKYNIVNYGNGSILGVEGTFWSEWIADKEKLEICMFPRMEALSEVAWTAPENRSYKEFKHRLEIFEQRYLDKKGVFYAEDSIANPKWYKRLPLKWEWYHKDPYNEVLLNRIAKAKKK